MVNNSYTDDLIAQAINKHYMWVLCSIGVPANSLTIVVIMTMQTLTPATFLIATLALVDGCALISKFAFMLLDFYDVPLCKSYFLVYFLSMMANWTLMYICLERFFTLCCPQKMIPIITLRRCLVCLSITAAALLSYLVPVFSVMLFWNYNEDSCWVYDEYEAFLNNYHKWINETLVLFISYATILVLTIRIVVKLRVNPEEYSRSEAPTPGNVLQENQSDERVSTTMVLCCAIFFITFTVPSLLYFLIDSDSIMYPKTFRQIKFLLYDSTHALNFFLYFLSATRFRRQCCKLFAGCRQSCWRGAGNESGLEEVPLKRSLVK
ncbi:uncharacterized protein LOC106054886 isoform X3 [Biomphalaria glabrata]|uniref:Uncharacterized protein LOC106054886 isoform X3 n=1 Tax=Biomphalaria glabrata TaxID=6526 RepID=A0A9U8DYD9_BIOGL|nr:uncharacterized protein LOC106054886 isoform X3 [Biomphalaria glabrata]